MKILRKILLVTIVLSLSYFTAIFFGRIYSYFFPFIQQGFFAVSKESVEVTAGFVFSYIFFLVLFFTIFGDSRKYWWMGILLIPAAFFEVYFDFSRIYFPIALALAGWGLGIGLLKLKQKLAAR